VAPPSCLSTTCQIYSESPVLVVRGDPFKMARSKTDDESQKVTSIFPIVICHGIITVKSTFAIPGSAVQQSSLSSIAF